MRWAACRRHRRDESPRAGNRAENGLFPATFAFFSNCAHTARTWLLRPVRRSASVDTDPLLGAPDETDPFLNTDAFVVPASACAIFVLAEPDAAKENSNGNRNSEVLQYCKRLWFYRAGRRRQGRVRSRVCGGSSGHALALGRPAGVVRHPAGCPWFQGDQSQGRLKSS